MAKLTYSFSLDSEKDRDLVRWLDGQSGRKRSETIRAALRVMVGRNTVTLSDIQSAVNDLGQKTDSTAQELAQAREAIANLESRLQAGAGLGQVLEAIANLESRLQAGAGLAGDASHQARGDEPAEAAAALDKLADL